MPSIPTPTTSGIITDDSGERHIPESVRPDGSVRKAIKIRPGYKPAEDAVLYKNRTAESFRNRHKGGVIGAEATTENGTSSSGSAAANKNAKRREARKKAATAAATTGNNKENGNSNSDDEKTNAAIAAPSAQEEKAEEEAVDPDAEKKKKVRNLTKKLKQAKELQEKSEGGQPLLPEQIAKVIKINELVRELNRLGFDADGELLGAIFQIKEMTLADDGRESKEKEERRQARGAKKEAAAKEGKEEAVPA